MTRHFIDGFDENSPDWEKLAKPTTQRYYGFLYNIGKTFIEVMRYDRVNKTDNYLKLPVPLPQFVKSVKINPDTNTGDIHVTFTINPDWRENG